MSMTICENPFCFKDHAAEDRKRSEEATAAHKRVAAAAEKVRPYCEAQAMGTLCGAPVDNWDEQCEQHDRNAKVTRFEVIDETGRVVVKYGVKVKLSYQDDGRTLKVFVEGRK